MCDVLQRLASLSKPFKYVVTCNLSQRAGAGMHISSSSYWNTKTDDKMRLRENGKGSYLMDVEFVGGGSGEFQGRPECCM